MTTIESTSAPSDNNQHLVSWSSCIYFCALDGTFKRVSRLCERKIEMIYRSANTKCCAFTILHLKNEQVSFRFLFNLFAEFPARCDGPHEIYACGGACDNVCATLHEQNQTHCLIKNIKCIDKCYCEEGYARDENNICIPIEKCKGEADHNSF